jgi:predicted SprT family Zn-dependent metalloprotease
MNKKAQSDIILALVEQEADKVWERYCKIYPTLNRRVRPYIVPNNRYTVTAATCEVAENTIHWGMKFMTPKNQDYMLRIVLPHEMAHQIDYILHGTPKNNRWHGPQWQAIMLNYGIPADPYHDMKV